MCSTISRKTTNSAKKEQTRSTYAFIATYLKKGDGNFRDFNKLYVWYQYVDKKHVKREIQNMNYQDFLFTRYWQIIRSYIISTKSKCTCEICGDQDHLEVHHSRYKHLLGEELNHLEELQCLCHHCHSKLHWLENLKKLRRAGKVILPSPSPTERSVSS